MGKTTEAIIKSLVDAGFYPSKQVDEIIESHVGPLEAERDALRERLAESVTRREETVAMCSHLRERLDTADRAATYWWHAYYEVQSRQRPTATDSATEAYAKELDALRQRLAAAEAVIAKLPKTADGVPVVPGMGMYSPHGPTPLIALFVDCSHLYSTREAAEAAQRKEE